MQKRGFTLIEVLIAAGILFMVAGAVAGLTNTIVQGTNTTADNTEVNRWASEGLELVTKVRNNSVANGGTVVAGSEKIWFAPAYSSTEDYGWYIITETGNLQKVSLGNRIEFNATDYEALKALGQELSSNSGLSAVRFICIEAFAAKSLVTENSVDCNTDANESLKVLTDGSRVGGLTDCDPIDIYCIASKGSLNENNTTGTDYISLPGNVVKLKSVIIWQDREETKVSEMSTLLTNWKGFEQN